ncbi:ribosome maturation factor RimM [Tellurirhabdus rosea]|uniref:ribosome maturation factor RimM n=1 Tax=Tellurirhabdus rosea TaxID=2674997 RepID=UPI0022539B7C|nr:ribosome maturation factor RimM [Tellurirhabdus rosea]
MTKDNCYQLGKITKTHGVQGELVFFLDVDAPREYEELESVLIEVRGELVPYFIESISINRDRAIVALEDVETIEAAQKLVNCDLYLPLENLDPLDESAFYFHEIIGFRVRDEQAGELGTVKAVYAMAVQDLIAMEYQGREVLIPSNSSIVKTVDRTEKVLNVALPEGLLDVYMDEDADKPDQPHGDEEDADESDETRFPDED